MFRIRLLDLSPLGLALSRCVLCLLSCACLRLDLYLARLPMLSVLDKKRAVVYKTVPVALMMLKLILSILIPCLRRFSLEEVRGSGLGTLRV